MARRQEFSRASVEKTGTVLVVKGIDCKDLQRVLQEDRVIGCHYSLAELSGLRKAGLKALLNALNYECSEIGTSRKDSTFYCDVKFAKHEVAAKAGWFLMHPNDLEHRQVWLQARNSAIAELMRSSRSLRQEIANLCVPKSLASHVDWSRNQPEEHVASVIVEETKPVSQADAEGFVLSREDRRRQQKQATTVTPAPRARHQQQQESKPQEKLYISKQSQQERQQLAEQLKLVETDIRDSEAELARVRDVIKATEERLASLKTTEDKLRASIQGHRHDISRAKQGVAIAA